MVDLFSDIANGPRHWATPAPDQTTVLGLVGGAVPANALACKKSILGMGQHSPVVLALSLKNDPENVYIAHSPTLIPANPMEATPYDDDVLVLVGDNLASVVPLVLPQDSFTRCTNTHALCITNMVGDPGFAGAPATVRFGPYTATSANVDSLRARKVFVMPPGQVVDALTSQDHGYYTNQDFYNTFLATNLASTDGNVVTAAQPLVEWFRLHCYKDGFDDGVLKQHDNIAVKNIAHGRRS